MRLRPFDLALAAVLTATVQAELWWYDDGPGGVPAVTAVASLLLTSSLALRSTRTEVMAGVAAATIFAQAMLGGRMTSTLSLALASITIVFSVGLLLPRRRALAWAAVLLAASWFDLVAIDHDDFGVLSDLVFTSVLVVGAPLLAGVTVRELRHRAGELERVNEELRAEREETARLAALDERARIAREVHDVVAHSVSLMVVQAGAARHLLERDPAQSREALGAVESVGRDALRELRRTLGVLREDHEDAAALAPQPGLAQLEQLVAGARSGLDVTLHVDLSDRHLLGAADVTAYRIVQEALTNALKHAPGAHVTVSVTADADGVRLLVEDDGATRPVAAATSRGHGLEGMRERVAMHGGRLDARPRPSGGFRVDAHLPVDGGTP
ncbi:sensor histidine kinase [Nocardioides sp. HDW12B]|uniref:sensor histidine kinase n=1 Tax=Nocardioides sp. HDW12B TaxID=2714939 RepID=UPI0014092E0F|nr:sensor histidine kinase [Nocardioides sp. HDW12B]QIK66681.1 sensor histidine kinase [Nocardioides sp. HDW12B]